MTTDDFIESIIPSKWEYEYADLVKVVEAEREACARVCEPKTLRPCDCESCDCGNSTSARMVAEWDESANIAKAIRARGDTC
jgi:hypothetical protein